MIKPTVGRVVHYYPSKHENPQAAIICHVHSEFFVNLVTFDPMGNPTGRTSVTLVQEGESRPNYHHCSWMPYQVGQAAKTDALQAQIDANTKGKA